MYMHERNHFISVIGLAILLILSVPFYSLAATNENADDSDAEPAWSKHIMHNEYFDGDVQPPPTHHYVSGPWEGTLYLKTHAYDGTRTIAVYEGTISCTADVCPLS